MKAYLQKLIGTAVLGLALCSNSIPAWAGSVTLYEVQVGTTSGYGTMAGARYSTDSQQYIGCTLQRSGGPYIRCSARDKTGRSIYCTSTDPRFVDAAKGITDSSFIFFNVAPSTTSCNRLEVDNSSAFLR
jgi:hypothetical protein